MPRSAQETRESVLLQHSLQLALSYLPNHSHRKHNSAGECLKSQEKASASCTTRGLEGHMQQSPFWSFSTFNKYTVDPWTTQVWNAYVHLYTFFFSINIDLALCILESCIQRFNQQCVENSIFHLRLGIHRGWGLTECLVPHHFIGQTWAYADFGIHWGSWNHTPGPCSLDTKEQLSLSFKGVKIYTWIFNCAVVSAPNSQLVQWSTVIYILGSLIELYKLVQFGEKNTINMLRVVLHCWPGTCIAYGKN